MTHVAGAGLGGDDALGCHVVALGMGATGDFGENASAIGLYSVPALGDAAGGGPVAMAALADRLWAMGDYPRALQLRRSGAGTPDDDRPDLQGERARLENNLACLYAALLRPREAIAVLEAARDWLAGAGSGAGPEILDANLGLCYLQRADLESRGAGRWPQDRSLKERLAGIDLRPENAAAINEVLRSLEDSERRARRAAAERDREKAIAVFEGLLQRHGPDANSPHVCFLRDCLAFCLLGAYDGYSPWPARSAARARALFRENRIWPAMMSGEPADATLLSRARWATVAGLAPDSGRLEGDAIAELEQVLAASEQASARVAAHCLLALAHLAMEASEEPNRAAPYAIRLAERCLQALGPEHRWSWYAADLVELIRTLVPTSGPKPVALDPPVAIVDRGPYARPAAGGRNMRVVPYVLAGDLLGAGSLCYELAAARTALHDDATEFHDVLRAAIEWRCDRDLHDLRQGAPDVDYSWLRSWLSQALAGHHDILDLASPGFTPA